MKKMHVSKDGSCRTCKKVVLKRDYLTVLCWKKSRIVAVHQRVVTWAQATQHKIDPLEQSKHACSE